MHARLLFFLALAWAIATVAESKAPPIRAVFKALVRHRHEDKDDTEDLQLDYTEETKQKMPEIIKERVSELVSRYCGDVTGKLAVFSLEYAQLLGVVTEMHEQDPMNATLPDVYDVSLRILTILKVYADKRPYINDTLAKCADAASNVTEDRHKALWKVGCMTNIMRGQRANHTELRLYKEWDTGPVANEAFRALGEIMECPHEMSRLALVQLDAEYKRDGIRQAEIAGKMSKERMDKILESIRVPTYAEYRVMTSPTFKDKI